MNKILTLSTEILILFFLLVLTFYNFDVFRGVGDAVFMVFYLFIAVFLIDGAFYIALRLLLDLKKKAFIKKILITFLSITLLGIAVFATITSTGRGERVGILFLFPFVLLGLRYLFLKVLVRKK